MKVKYFDLFESVVIVEGVCYCLEGYLFLVIYDYYKKVIFFEFVE